MSKQTDLINIPDAITVSGSNVGIGTTSPSQKLEVSDTTNQNVVVRVTNNDGNVEMQKYQDDLYLNLNDTGNIIVRSGSPIAERLRIDASGNVGIRTSSIVDTAWYTASGDNTELALDGNSGYGLMHFRGTGAGSTDTKYTQGVGNGKFYMAYDAVANAHRMTIDSSGRVIMPYQPSFSVSKTGGSVGAGTFVVWNHVEHNVGSHYNTSNGVFTAPVSGVYAVSLNVMDESNAVHVNKELNIYRNSYIYQRVYGTNNVAGSHGRWTWSGNIYMSANDTLQVLVNNMTIYGNQRDYSNFSGFLVG